MHKLYDRVRFKTFLGDIREGVIKERNGDGSFFIEIDEQLIPDIGRDLYCKDASGRPFIVYKNKFPNWQAWVKPEWIISKVETQVRRIVSKDVIEA